MEKKITAVLVLLALVGVANTVLAFEVFDSKLASPINTIFASPTVTAESSQSDDAFCWDFNRPLRLGDQGADVRALHTVLEKEGFEINADFDVFSENTASAVMGFQEKYPEVLEKANISKASGFVGLSTRTKLTEIYGCKKNIATKVSGLVLGAKASFGAPIFSKPVAPIRVSFSGVEPEELINQIATGVTLSAKYDSFINDDMVSWKSFSSGSGNLNKSSKDIVWKATLKMSVQKAIKSITLYNGVNQEVWSTTRVPVHGTLPYPLLVTYNGDTLNTEYDQKLGIYGPGTEVIVLHGQGESSVFANGKIVIYFFDGTGISSNIDGSYSASNQSALLINSESPSINVISPNGGETWTKGSYKDVVWSSRIIPSVVPASLLLREARTGAEVKLEDGIVNSGQKTIKVPADIVSGEYYLEIRAEYGPGIFIDDSNRPIFVTNDKEKILRENVTCTFNNSFGLQKCFTLDGEWGCSGTDSCSASVEGIEGSGVFWKNSCDGSAYTNMDGKNEELTFLCKSKEPVVKIISPNGGETFDAGSSQKVSWQIGNPDDLIAFYLLPDDISISNTIASLGESRSFVWDIPKNTPSGIDYKIEARLFRPDEKGLPRFVASDKSDATFVINGVLAEETPKLLSILSPNGGDGWTVGKSYTVSFGGVEGDSPAELYLERYAVADSANQKVMASILMGEVPVGTTTFTYSVPEKIASWPGVGGDYKVKICSANCASSDSSDSYFSISNSADTSENIGINFNRQFSPSQVANVLESLKSIISGIRSFLR